MEKFNFKPKTRIYNEIFEQKSYASGSAGSIITPQLPNTGNAGFQITEQIRIRIPCGRKGLFLDPSQTTLEFNVLPYLPTVPNAYIDATPSSLFRRIQITTEDGEVLEDISHYNFIFNTLLQCIMQATDWVEYASIVYQTSPANPLLGGPDFGNGSIHLMEIPLMSGIIGFLNQKMLPISEIDRDLFLVLYPEDPNICISNSGGKNAVLYSIFNCSLNLTYVKVEDRFLKELKAENSGRFEYNSTTYNSFYTSIPKSTQAYDFKLNLPYSSLRYILAGMRSSTYFGNGYQQSISARVADNLLNYQFKIGNSNYPSRPVDTGGPLVQYLNEAFIQLLKCFDDFSFRIRFGSFDNSNYDVRTDNASTGSAQETNYNNQFLIGQNFCVEKKNEHVISGLNCREKDCYLRLNFGNSSAGASIDLLLDVISCIDISIIIENGQIHIAL